MTFQTASSVLISTGMFSPRDVHHGGLPISFDPNEVYSCELALFSYFILEVTVKNELLYTVVGRILGCHSILLM